jgi:hypothetical protein
MHRKVSRPLLRNLSDTHPVSVERKSELTICVKVALSMKIKSSYLSRTSSSSCYLTGIGLTQFLRRTFSHIPYSKYVHQKYTFSKFKRPVNAGYLSSFWHPFWGLVRVERFLQTKVRHKLPWSFMHELFVSTAVSFHLTIPHGQPPALCVVWVSSVSS